jgi:hypothetical protein
MEKMRKPDRLAESDRGNGDGIGINVRIVEWRCDAVSSEGRGSVWEGATRG